MIFRDALGQAEGTWMEVCGRKKEYAYGTV